MNYSTFRRFFATANRDLPDSDPLVLKIYRAILQIFNDHYSRHNSIQNTPILMTDYDGITVGLLYRTVDSFAVKCPLTGKEIISISKDKIILNTLNTSLLNIIGIYTKSANSRSNKGTYFALSPKFTMNSEDVFNSFKNGKTVFKGSPVLTGSGYIGSGSKGIEITKDGFGDSPFLKRHVLNKEKYNHIMSVRRDLANWLEADLLTQAFTLQKNQFSELDIYPSWNLEDTVISIMKKSSIDIFSDASVLREAFQEAMRIHSAKMGFRSVEYNLDYAVKLLRKSASAFMDAVYEHYNLLEYK